MANTTVNTMADALTKNIGKAVDIVLVFPIDNPPRRSFQGKVIDVGTKVFTLHTIASTDLIAHIDNVAYLVILPDENNENMYDELPYYENI